MKKPCFILSIFFAFIIFSTHGLPAQKGIGISAGYSNPTKTLGIVYKGAPSIEISFRKWYGPRIEAFAGLGFNSFSPKMEAFYFYGEQDTGVSTYSKYWSIPLVLGVNFHPLTNGPFSPYIGFSAGYYYGGYTYTYNDKYINEEGTIMGGFSGIAPKAGLNIFFGESLALDANWQYSFIIMKSDGNGPNNVNQTLTYMTMQVGINYYFGGIDRMGGGGAGTAPGRMLSWKDLYRKL